MASTYTEAVEAFLEASEDDITDLDLPAVVTLQTLAAELDNELTPSLVAQFSGTYRALLKRVAHAPLVETIDEMEVELAKLQTR